ncbi:MAG: hypothetical protein P9X26_07795 [Candidatus Stygibacter frigidus]|nr:hypothetical protein [Candidatus Stygibacter frigidus]
MELRLKVIYSDFLDDGMRMQILESLFIGLQAKGVHAIECDGDYQGLLILTGGTEQLAIEEFSRHTGNEMILFTHRGNNSLAAALEITAFLQRQGRNVKIIDLEGQDFDLETRGDQIIVDKARCRPLASRIGVIGEPSDWLIASSYPEEILSKTWDTELVKVNISYLEELILRFMDESESGNIIQCVAQVKEPLEQDLINSDAVFKALKQLISEYDLDAITVRCFDLVKDMSMTACYALGKLNSENIPAGCEGDIASITGMVWAHKQTGNIPWMANPARIDRDRSIITLAHCTAPLNVLKQIVLRSHFESGLGVGIQGKLNYDEVTLFRLGGRNLDEIWVAEGRVTGHLQEENLCRTQLEISIDPGELTKLLDRPLGNHLLVLPGRYKREFLATDLCEKISQDFFRTRDRSSGRA